MNWDQSVEKSRHGPPALGGSSSVKKTDTGSKSHRAVWHLQEGWEWLLWVHKSHDANFANEMRKCLVYRRAPRCSQGWEVGWALLEKQKDRKECVVWTQRARRPGPRPPELWDGEGAPTPARALFLLCACQGRFWELNYQQWPALLNGSLVLPANSSGQLTSPDQLPWAGRVSWEWAWASGSCRSGIMQLGNTLFEKKSFL